MPRFQEVTTDTLQVVNGVIMAPFSIARVELDAAKIAGLVDTNPVTTWVDSTGNGYSLVQGTGVKEPLYRTAIVNGFPVVRGDGVDDTMAIAGASISQPVTLVFVGNIKDALGGYPVVFTGFTAPTMSLYRDQDVGNAWAIAGSVGLFSTVKPPVGDTAFHVVVAVFNGPQSVLAIDGQEFYGDTGNRSFNGGITLFGDVGDTGNKAQSDVALIRVLPFGIGRSERDNIARTYGLKYNIQLLG